MNRIFQIVFSCIIKSIVASLLVAIFFVGNAFCQTNSSTDTKAPKQFRAGAATSNITPPLGVSINGNFTDAKATYIHDELHARCLVLDDGDTRIAFVVCDSCLIPREIFDEAKRLIHETTGLATDHILISSTHTHSAPGSASVFQSEAVKDYIPFLVTRISDGVRRAIHNLAPARIAWGGVDVPDQVFNRRWKMKPGALLANPFGGFDQVRMNPPAANPALLEPAGPTDPGLSFISVQGTNGHPIALLANYSLHYVGGVPTGDISADYYGAFAERIGQLVGGEHQDPEFVGILCNGTSGDINNMNFRTPHSDPIPYHHMRVVTDEIAGEIYRIAQTLHYTNWVPLRVAQKEINMGVRLPSATEVEQARQILANHAAQQILAGQDEKKSRTMKEIYAQETLYMKDYPPEVSLIIQTFRIGDLGIAALPCEAFAQIGLDIKAKSPFKPTFTITLANGWSGYVPTPDQHLMGGYETWRSRASYLETNASVKMIDTVMQLFGQMR